MSKRKEAESKAVSSCAGAGDVVEDAEIGEGLLGGIAADPVGGGEFFADLGVLGSTPEGAETFFVEVDAGDAGGFAVGHAGDGAGDGRGDTAGGAAGAAGEGGFRGGIGQSAWVLLRG